LFPGVCCHVESGHNAPLLQRNNQVGRVANVPALGPAEWAMEASTLLRFIGQVLT